MEGNKDEIRSWVKYDTDIIEENIRNPQTTVHILYVHCLLEYLLGGMIDGLLKWSWASSFASK